MKRLPDAEFEVMKIIWDSTPPVTTLEIMEKLKDDKKWKSQTVLTMLVRLIEKGFLQSERVGRERNYTPKMPEQDYMRIETGDFMKRYIGNTGRYSVGVLVKTMFEDQNLSKEDLQELKDWLAKKKK
ncbi:MAG: BlaI/MecI/CopY family transcriptional regulator [Treponema sp.]|jgi:predicted transcriptional regulator|nr:BlaI/MecI/CopY family transcriptional regulator [Treponema sp.]